VAPLRSAGLVRVAPAPQLALEVGAVLADGVLRPARDGGPVRLPEGLAGALEKTWEFLSKIIPVPR